MYVLKMDRNDVFEHILVHDNAKPWFGNVSLLIMIHAVSGLMMIALYVK